MPVPNAGAAHDFPFEIRRTKALTLPSVLLVSLMWCVAPPTRVLGQETSAKADLPWPPVATFSILGYDPDPEQWTKEGRQFSVMDGSGNVATHTGSKASTWAGHKIDRYVSAQGNILAGPEVEGHLSFRLMAALEAGQAAGGDIRGMQSAAMLIVKEDGGSG